MTSHAAQGGGIGLMGALFVLFVGLKLADVIAWSWWWVFAPLWGPVVLVLVFLLVWAVWSTFR